MRLDAPAATTIADTMHANYTEIHSMIFFTFKPEAIGAPSTSRYATWRACSFLFHHFLHLCFRRFWRRIQLPGRIGGVCASLPGDAADGLGLQHHRCDGQYLYFYQ